MLFNLISVKLIHWPLNNFVSVIFYKKKATLYAESRDAPNDYIIYYTVAQVYINDLLKYAQFSRDADEEF